MSEYSCHSVKSLETVTIKKHYLSNAINVKNILTQQVIFTYQKLSKFKY